MPLLTILQEDEKQAFETPPVFTAEERKRFFTLPNWAQEIVTTLQTPANKIGFSLQLAYFQATKKYYATDTFHQTDINLLIKRLQISEVVDLGTYAETTRRRHRALIREKLGYSPFSSATQALLTKEIDFLLSKQTRLIRQAIEKELNKLEHTNNFSKAVFHDNNHEFRQETREEQLIAEGCKRLIENAIILWNYLYLSEKVFDTPEGKQREELLHQIKYSSMACWEHINMLGEYDYSEERVNNLT